MASGAVVNVASSLAVGILGGITSGVAGGTSGVVVYAVANIMAGGAVSGVVVLHGWLDWWFGCLGGFVG